MWLLRTDRAELHFFARNFDATGGYVILSHTWVGNEQTFQEVKAIAEQCHRDGTNPRDFVHAKIRNCCIAAEKRGYRWVWIDSCCIDKTSSSELSEAINSMFRWYKEAEVCLAYLADVPSNGVLSLYGSAFRKSRWHTRAWTLQELIAPEILIFLSAEWHELGDRVALAALLEEITRVPSGVLNGKSQLAQYSVFTRISWASDRKTRRVEDEAYCLMGLFGVYMPTNYGEGKQAFLRLQYEIMRRDADMSLFAFGYRIYQHYNLTYHLNIKDGHVTWRYLMADSPREFQSGFSYTPGLGTNTKQQYPPALDSTLTGPFEGGIELPRVAVTSYGVRLRVPVFEANGITIAFLLCYLNGRYFGLFLTRDIEGKDPKRPRYFVGCTYTQPETGSTQHTARLADLGDDLYRPTFNRMPIEASWRTIYVVPTAPDLGSGRLTTPNLIINCNPASRFRVPRWLISRFTGVRFVVWQLQNTETLQRLLFFLYGVVRIYVHLGSCVQQHDRDPNDPPLLWAKVDIVFPPLTNMDSFTVHNCAEDHIDSNSWSTHSKFFGDADRGVQLSLTPSTEMPDSLLVVHLELLGHVFQKILQDAGEPSLFPSLAALKKETPRIAPDRPTASSQLHPGQLPINSNPPRRSVSTRELDSPSPSPVPKSRRLTLDASAPAPLSASSQDSPSKVLQRRSSPALRAHVPHKAFFRRRRVDLNLARKPGHKRATTTSPGRDEVEDRRRHRKGRSRGLVGSRRPPRPEPQPPVRTQDSEPHKETNEGRLESDLQGDIEDPHRRNR